MEMDRFASYCSPGSGGGDRGVPLDQLRRQLMNSGKIDESGNPVRKGG